MEYNKNMKNILQADVPMRRTTPVDDVFTLFVILPTEEVCTLRHLQSGISVEDVKSRMELAAGLPSQTYQLVYPDGECLGDKKNLLMQKNVRDGYILRVVLHENWESLFQAIFKNHIDHVCHGEALNIKGNVAINADDVEKVDSIVNERRNVALYIACFLGHIKMCNTLLSIGKCTYIHDPSRIHNPSIFPYNYLTIAECLTIVKHYNICFSLGTILCLLLTLSVT